MSRLPTLYRWVLGVLLVGPSAACLGSTEPEFQNYDPQVIEETDFAASLEIDLGQMTETEIGVYIQDLVVGEGPEVEAGTVFDADYTGWLSNGFEFDSGTLADWLLGGDEYRLIPGFEYGLLGMQAGGTRRMIIPPEWAYGRAGAPPNIPPGAILVFVVELVNASEA